MKNLPEWKRVVAEKQLKGLSDSVQCDVAKYESMYEDYYKNHYVGNVTEPQEKTLVSTL